LSAPPASLANTLRDRYTIERELGRGGMATVYLAHDLRHKRRVALKVLDPELAHALGSERFRREIETVARLQHPHILPVFDSGEAAETQGAPGRQLWYTMPYVSGESLRDRLRREGRLDIQEALRLVRQIADALSYAHRHGVIHRDIKPGNILLSEGHALVADFGIARHARRIADAADDQSSETLTGTGISLGTPAYLSPEQALGSRDVDGRTDQYALGCVLYEMLAGIPPYGGSSAQAVIGQHVTAPVPDLQAARPDVPVAVAAAVAKAMAKTPEERFASTIEFADALESADPALEHARPAPTMLITPRQLSRRRVIVGSVALLAAALIAVVALLRRSGSASSLDQHLLAIAPFEVLAPELAVWREGMVDYLSRNLDGAGSLRTVSPTAVLRQWQGRADRAAAIALGNRTGAGLVLYGQLLRVGRDSVRVVASLVDARRGTVMAVAEGEGVRQRIDQAADAVAVEILRRAGSPERAGQFARSRFGSRSPAAVRSFLVGEQFYRRGAWDSAITRYREAVEADTSFTLAYWRLGKVLGWRGVEDPLPFLFRAGAHARDLSPRDRVLVTADSIGAALATSPVPLGLSPRYRLLGMLEEAARRDPNDLEVWYQLGEARVHWGPPGEVSAAEALRAFERAIALDSLFIPAYVHCVPLELAAGDPAAALRYFDRMQALGADLPPETTAQGQRYLLRAAVSRAPVDEDSVTLADLRFAVTNLFLSPDTGPTTVSVARALLRKGHNDPLAFAPADSGFAAQVLAYQGYVAEAVRVGGNNFGILVQLALLGAVPAERIERVLSASAPPDEVPFEAPAWWRARGDTVALRRMALRRGDAAARLNASAYLALARRDTTSALRALTTLTDTGFPGFGGYSVALLDRARLLAATGAVDQARRVYRRQQGAGEFPSLMSILMRLELAELAERQGAREEALDAYQFVTAIWRHADLELQPYVKRAREGIARLASEPRQGASSAGRPRD